jgi:hypothetical protein
MVFHWRQLRVVLTRCMTAVQRGSADIEVVGRGRNAQLAERGGVGAWLVVGLATVMLD